MTNEENNRREFEEWADKNGYDLLPAEYAKDIYRDANTRWSWEAWQAARERQGKPVKYCVWYYDDEKRRDVSGCGKWLTSIESECDMKHCPFCGGVALGL